MRLNKYFYNLKILLWLVILLSTCSSCCIFSKKNKPFLVERARLDSVFHEKPESLIIDVSPTGTTFVTHGTLNPKRITLSQPLVSILKNQYKFADIKPVIEGILAHEYGHIMQLDRNPEIFNQEVIAFREYQADFIAGFYVSNKYRFNILQKKEPNMVEIFKEICSFLKNREGNQEMYLMLAMLMNDDKEHSFSANDVKINYGMAADTVQVMRFASLWEGFRNSSTSSIEEVYRLSLESTRKRVENLREDKISGVFFLIGSDIILKILKGQLNSTAAIDAIINRIDMVPGLVPDQDKFAYRLLLETLKVTCQ